LVKLQKRFAYAYKNKDHFKHILTIPEEIVEKLGWKEGDELDFQIENHKVSINKTRKVK